MRKASARVNFPLWKKLLLGVCGIAAADGRPQAQPPAAPPVSYVASVRLNNGSARTFSEYLPGGRLTATAITVRDLLRNAYRIQRYQLAGAPGWISTKRYDIAAKSDDNPPPSQQTLLRALLKDRFNLTAHNEIREMPIFALALARSDGKPGPGLRKSGFDCDLYFAGPHGPPELGRTPNCATRIGPGSLSGKAIPMTQLATSLAPFLNRFTVDRTGLPGRFDVDLTWTPEPLAAQAPDAPTDISTPSIFAALQEQLGLKLVSEKGPVDILVVDRLEQPSEN